MRRARTVDGSDALETKSFKDMILGHPSRKRSANTKLLFQLLSRGGCIQPEDKCLLGLTIQAIHIGNIASLEKPSSSAMLLSW